MSDDFKRLMWIYRAVFTQTDVGGGTVNAVITMRERSVLLYGLIGSDDYAAGRVVQITARAADDTDLAVLMYQGAVDNQRFSFPVSDHSVFSATDGPQLEKRLVMGIGEKILVSAASLVQNETLTVSVHILLGDNGAPPTITTTGSGGTVTITETYNKVI